MFGDIPMKSKMIRKAITGLAVVCSSMAASANYEGIYVGSFNGNSDVGAFAVLVKHDNTAVVLGYDRYDNVGFMNEGVFINPDGAFSKTNIDGDGTLVSGTVDPLSITGSYSNILGGGTLSGDKQSYVGPMAAHDGYYKGTFSTSCPSYGINASGYFRAIVSADGNVYAYTQYTASNSPYLPVGSQDGGILSASGSMVSGFTVNGAYVSGAVSGNTVSGTFSFTGCSGTFSGSLAYALDLADADADKISDGEDNCPNVPNSDQADADSDGYGDACDALPNDGSEHLDSDSDGVGDNADNCPLDPNPLQENTDGANDGGDACDTDDDNDSVADVADNCPLVANANQADLDSDGIGDLCDNDADGDGLDSSQETAAGTNPLQEDTDGDGLNDGQEIGIGTNPLDTDTDGDGISDGAEYAQGRSPLRNEPQMLDSSVLPLLLE